MKLLKKWFKKLQSNMAYTLIEVSAVVAITATLGAVVVPIALDKTTEGKLSAARSDTQSIGGAITSFYKDTGQWPASSLGTDTHFVMLRSGADTTNAVFGGKDPVAGVDLDDGVWTGNIDILNNHLIVDNPGGAQGSENGGYALKKWNWKGPYAESFNKKDPWNNNYLVYVKAMYNATAGTTKEYGWIISAGPNAKLETGVKDAVLKGDDIGYALFSADSGR